MYMCAFVAEMIWIRFPSQCSEMFKRGRNFQDTKAPPSGNVEKAAWLHLKKYIKTFFKARVRPALKF